MNVCCEVPVKELVVTLTGAYVAPVGTVTDNAVLLAAVTVAFTASEINYISRSKQG